MDYSIGLSEKEAEIALAKFGRNELAKRSKVAIFGVLFNQIKSPLVYVLLLAAVVNAFVGEAVDSLVILATVVVNTALGFVQEFKAERSLESLANLIVPRAKVRRDGQWGEFEAVLIAPGDVVRLEVGQRVPADGVLTRADGLLINEAILTGESVSREKKTFQFEEGFTIYKFQLEEVREEYKCQMGTVVERGLGEMLVVRTGMETNLGKIAESLTGQTIGKTPLQAKLDHLAKLMVAVFLAMVPVVIGIGLVSGKGKYEVLLLAVALAVSAIPEGLAVGLTVILTVGMKKILLRRALVSKLAAAETLGSVDVICLDKTGTVTEGRMGVAAAITSLGEEPEQEKLGELVRGATLCNDERDPLETAMREWASNQPTMSNFRLSDWKRVASLPFDFAYKYIVTRHTKGKETVEFISGAPEVILQLSAASLQLAEVEKWKENFAVLGRQGYRMVGFGVRRIGPMGLAGPIEQIRREEVGGYQWLGVITFDDPVRAGAAASLTAIKRAGISIKIVTGDYKETAWAVLAAAGLVTGELEPERVVTGEELGLGSELSKKKVERAVLFARVTPEQKLTIVRLLQEGGRVVAMTGDGVNDAPALKQADIGVVMAGASDVARETAELVLLDNNFETILAAVEEGRAMFDNLRKIVLYLLSDSFAAIFLIIFGLILGWPLPLLATQILWINLISDGLPYMALAVDPREADLLERKPLSRNEPIIDKRMFALIGVISLAAGLIATLTFGWYYYVWQLPLALSRTVTLITLSGVTLIYVFSVRSLAKPIWKNGLFRNKWLWLGVVASFLMQVAVVYFRPLQFLFSTVPLLLTDWFWVVVWSLTLLFVVEVVKWKLIGRLKVVK